LTARQLKRIQARIHKSYGTQDPNEIWTLAARRRVGTRHEEMCGQDMAHCQTCGLVTAENGDPLFHPEAYIEG
jgi:hypothetical protein